MTNGKTRQIELPHPQSVTDGGIDAVVFFRRVNGTRSLLQQLTNAASSVSSAHFYLLCFPRSVTKGLLQEKLEAVVTLWYLTTLNCPSRVNASNNTVKLLWPLIPSQECSNVVNPAEIQTSE